MVSFSNPALAPIPSAFVRNVVAAFQRARPSARGRSVSVILVDAPTSRRLNRTYRHVNQPTDVLSFPGQTDAPWPGDDRSLGEVIICYPIAFAQARDLNHSVRREVAELLVHGLAHLAGYDHATPRAAKQMAAVETKAMEKLGGKIA